MFSKFIGKYAGAEMMYGILLILDFLKSETYQRFVTDLLQFLKELTHSSETSTP